MCMLFDLETPFLGIYPKEITVQLPKHEHTNGGNFNILNSKAISDSHTVLTKTVL